MNRRALGTMAMTLTLGAAGCGQSSGDSSVEPSGHSPMILRTDPSNGADDVPLNTRIIVVFSEPIDPATATRARVQLRRRGLPVAADISFSESALEMEVRPEGGLAPLSSYALVVSAELADPGGDRLKEGVQVEFTTGTTLHWDIAPGQYDLSAKIDIFDRGWGYDLTNYRYTAVLYIEPGAPTFRDMWLIGPGGDSVDIATSGVITPYVDFAGRFALDLVRPEGERGSPFTLTLVVEDVVPETFEGNWGCCGHIAGSFTAKRKAP